MPDLSDLLVSYLLVGGAFFIFGATAFALTEPSEVEIIRNADGFSLLFWIAGLTALVMLGLGLQWHTAVVERGIVNTRNNQ